MESQVARRRVNVIAAHFAASEDISAAATTTHIFPMNCSGILNSAVRRGDNRMRFARQGSASQACFMRPQLTEQSGLDQSALPYKSAASGYSSSPNAPLFSRPSSIPSPGSDPAFPMVQNYKSTEAVCDPPMYSRPNRTANGPTRLRSNKRACSFESRGYDWSPKIDAAESRSSYVVTVELSGVNINDIRVEVHDKYLMVSGKRSIHWWKGANCSDDSISTYHKREISQGQYRVVWPLPNNVNKNNISADFVDGFLRITIPKL